MAVDQGVDLTWYGQSMFAISVPGLTVVTDPVPPEAGYRYDPVAADLVLQTHQHFDHSFLAGVAGDPRVISTPGAFEAGGMTIRGIATFHDAMEGRQRGSNIIFTWEQGGLRFAHFGDLGCNPGREAMGSLEGVDVAMVPVGGVFTIDGAEAAALVEDLGCRVVLPMHYATPDCTIKIDGVDAFTGSFGGPVRRIDDRPLHVASSTLPAATEAWIVSYQ